MAGSGGEPRRAAVLFGAVEHPWQRIGRPLVAGEPLLAWREQVQARVRGELAPAATRWPAAGGAAARRRRPGLRAG
ncbi:MAG: hypothetical protein ABSA53_26880 [Streptosporangiaceae bacterium]